MKKQFIYILVLLCTTVLTAQEVTWQKEFDKANNAFDKEHYAEAIQEYLSIAKSVDNSSELYFNLANAYYKVKDNVNAVYYYEKALKLSPNYTSIATNLDFARKDLEDDITIITEYDKKDIMHQTLGGLSSDTWAVVATLLSFVVFASFVMYYMSTSGRVKRITLSLLVVAFLGVLGSIWAANFESDYKNKAVTGIVFAKEVELREDANSMAKSLKTIHEGAKVYVLETKSLWIKVRLDNLEEGWIEKKTIKEI